MTKNHTFIASDILTPELMNGLTQDSQIVSASAKQDNSDSIATTQWVRSASGDTALNAATATKLKNARSLKISDADGSNVADAITFDGSGDATLKLPAKIKGNLEGTASHAVNADEAEHSLSADTAVTQATSDNSNKIATTKFVKQVAYNADNPPPNPFEDWRRVVFTWRNETGLDDNIAASAEIVCHKDFINWSYKDYALSDISITGIDGIEIPEATMVAFLKSLGYGGRSTYYMGARQERIFPMTGLSKFVSYNDSVRPSDIIAGVFVNRDLDSLTYLTALNYSTSGLNSAKIYAVVRRLM